MLNRIERIFDEKIEVFNTHEKYADLRRYADKVLLDWTGDSHDGIAYEDFLYRIISMPVDYIRGWLDGKHQLAWTPEYTAMLTAIKGDYVELLEKYPDAVFYQANTIYNENFCHDNNGIMEVCNGKTFVVIPSVISCYA